MNNIFLHLSAILSLTAPITTYTISSNQQYNEFGQKDCLGQTRNGIRIHDLVFEDDQIRRLSYPTLCCDDYYIRLSDSSIPTLATESFGTRPNYVVDIRMNNTNISKILPGTFKGLNYLNCLDLSHNNISFIQFGIFNGLQRLYHLNLANNNIKQIFDEAFDNVPLRKIFLQENLISFLNDNLFSSQKTSLTMIDLSKNSLKGINNTFVGMKALVTLKLNQNFIRDLDIANIYSDEIYLRKNNISHIRAMRKQTKVIDLSENNIRSIEGMSNAFINSSIVKLYLSQNEIELNQNSLVGLYNLTHLYLDHNKYDHISNSVFKDLKSLIFLDLSHNKIGRFQYGTFDHVTNMQYLNISHNNITELQVHILSPLVKLTELDFQSNQIDHIDIDSLLYHCSSMRKINLDGNFWNCKALTNIVKRCQMKNVEIIKGISIDSENVKGIACNNDDFEISKNATEVNDAEINETTNKFFDIKIMENSSFFNFFQKDFEKSNFYKYLKNFNTRKAEVVIDLNDTSFYNFFNKDYKQSNLFKYFENLRSSEMSETPIEYFHFLFIFGVSLMAVLVLIFVTVFTIGIVLLKKRSSKSVRGMSNQENVELL